MADSSQVRSKIQVFLQRKSADRVKSTLFDAMPTLDFFFSLNGQKKDADGLGRPEAGMLAIGRITGASAPRRANLERAREYLPLVQTSKPSKSDAKKMGDYDADPTVPNWDTTNSVLGRYKQPRFKYSRIKMPYKVAHSEIRTAMSGASTEGQAAKALGPVYDAEVKNRTASLCELWNDELWGVNGQQGYPTDEDAVTWDNIHSIDKALGTSNVYGGIDRNSSTNDWWRSNRVTSTFTGTFEDMIDYTNYDLGLMKKGLGISLVIVGKTLMKRAKAEAKTNGYQMIADGLPDPEYGFKRERVVIGAGNRKVYVIYEPAVDAVDTATSKKNAYLLDPSTWTIAIPSDRNFKVSKPVAANEVDEGGDEADFGTIETEALVCCEVPSGNAVFEDVQ